MDNVNFSNFQTYEYFCLHVNVQFIQVKINSILNPENIYSLLIKLENFILHLHHFDSL